MGIIYRLHYYYCCFYLERQGVLVSHDELYKTPEKINSNSFFQDIPKIDFLSPIVSPCLGMKSVGARHKCSIVSPEGDYNKDHQNQYGWEFLKGWIAHNSSLGSDLGS